MIKMNSVWFYGNNWVSMTQKQMTLCTYRFWIIITWYNLSEVTDSNRVIIKHVIGRSAFLTWFKIVIWSPTILLFHHGLFKHLNMTNLTHFSHSLIQPTCRIIPYYHRFSFTFHHHKNRCFFFIFQINTCHLLISRSQEQSPLGD